MAAVVNSSYLIPVTDLRVPIEGLIGVEKRKERAILCFDSIENRDLFWSDVNKSPEARTIKEVVRAQAWGYTAYERSEKQCLRHCLLSYRKHPLSATNVFDWLMDHWKGNSPDPKRGFVSRIFDCVSWANTSPRGSPASYKDAPQILQEEDESSSSPESPSTPRSSDTRLKKHFKFPTEEKERTAVKRCHDGTEKRY